MERIDRIKDALTDMGDSTIAWIWNEYCDKVKYTDDQIFSMGDFDELNYHRAPIDIANDVSRGNFNPNDEWFRYTIWGIESGDAEDFVDYDALAEYIDEYDEDFGDSDLREALEEEEEEDEEEDLLEPMFGEALGHLDNMKL